MSRTNGTFQQKTPNADGLLVLSAEDFISVGAAGPVITLNAKGDVSQNQAASLACKYVASLSKAILRSLNLSTPFLQEQFGTAAGVAGPTAVANTGDPDGDNAVPAYPPYTAATLPTRIGQDAQFVAKGIQVNDITLHYFIGTNPLTVHTLGLSKTVKPVPGTPGALVVTDIIANAANGLATAANASPQSTKVANAAAAMLTSDLSEYIIEVDATTPAGGTYRLYGATVHVSFNFN